MAEFATWTPYWEAVAGALKTVAGLALIIVPLMVGIELLRHFDVLDRWSRAVEPGARWLGLSAEAALPLVAGTAFGIAYGSGVIIDSAREGRLTHRDALLLTAFLAPFHAVFEDTLIFVPQGVNPFLLLGLRFVTALTVTVVLARFGLGRSLAAVTPQTEAGSEMTAGSGITAGSEMTAGSGMTTGSEMTAGSGVTTGSGITTGSGSDGPEAVSDGAPSSARREGRSEEAGP